jgi:RNA polymerase-binding transcription factor DksA
MPDFTRTWDVLVVGGGNAALSAAITAAQAGASVIIAEHAPKTMRGGNSRHTRNLRALHPAPTDVLTDSYLEEEYWDDLLRVTGGRTDEALARIKDGTFGHCENCDENIEIRRLQANPTTTLCIACKEEEEKQAASSILGHRQHVH